MGEFRGRVGQALAGLNAFSHIPPAVNVLGFLSALGSTASWLAKYYRGATHWFWDYLFQFVPWLHIQLTADEKDCLTTIAFFLPIFIHVLSGPAFIPELARQKGDHTLKAMFVPVLGLFAGFGLIYALAHQIFQVSMSAPIGPLAGLLGLSPETMAYLVGKLTAVVFCVIGINLMLVGATEMGWRYAAWLNRVLLWPIVVVAIAGGATLILIALAATVMESIRIYPTSGLIMAVSAPLITMMIIAVALWNPRSMIKIAAIVVALVAASMTWDAVLLARTAIESHYT